MKVEEFLNQARYLDQRINNDLDELSNLSEMRKRSSGIGAESIIEMQDKINSEIDLLVDLKEQIKDTISSVPNPDESMLLEYRYIKNYTLSHIAEIMHVSIRTVLRWQKDALEHLAMPDDPIEIRKEN